MFRRLYIDNYRTLVNFELEFENLTLLLGPNGSGKSSVFEVIHFVRDFISGRKTTNEAFTPSSLTRWQERPSQVFEFSLSGNEGTYEYTLHVEHNASRQTCRIHQESLKYNNLLLYKSEMANGQLQAHLFRDDGSKGPSVLTDWSRSAIAAIPERNDYQLMKWFKNCMDRIVIIKLIPVAMDYRSKKESVTLDFHGGDFVSWIRYYTDLDMNLMSQLKPLYEEVLTGFSGLSLVPDGGDAKVLKVVFKSEEGLQYECRFDELSDGQRLLLVLYTLPSIIEKGALLLIDEPENFIALREIQPWLNLILEKTQGGAAQAILISHHPEFINALALECGRWLERPSGGPTRSMPVTQDNSGLPVSELVARGWLNA